MPDDLNPSLPLCENCKKPAVYVWTTAFGDETTCERCRPATGTEVRKIEEQQPAPVADRPLTVEQAAEREQVSERTIRRWLPELQEDGGAWRAGAHWRIDPAALDKRRTQGPKSRPQRSRPNVRRTPSSPKTPSGIAWPK